MQGPSSTINTLATAPSRNQLSIKTASRDKERGEMAKMTVIAAILAITLLAVAGVSGFRATITTTFDEEVDQGRGEQEQTQQRCRQQIQQRQQQLRHCQQFLQQQSQGSPYEPIFLNQQEQQQQHLRQCCQQMRDLDEQCRCEAVKHVVRQLQQGQGPFGQQGPQQQQQQQQILQRARQLPGICNLQPRECQIEPQQPYLYY